MGLCRSKLPQTGRPLRPKEKDILKSPLIIFVMGGPGCGKGTQCKYMATKYGLCHVGLGQLLRQEAQRGTQRGRQIHDLMRQGLLVPTGIVLDMVSDNMLSHPESRGFLIDGFPRELKQAQEFERIGPGGAPGGRRGAGHPAAPGDALHPVRARPDLLPAEEPAAKRGRSDSLTFLK
ncbi:adenylate kinase isoenzyme 1 isoform X5 [Microcebus murinus]|uniref:adenylate kinase isoenzyme 1 isoform X5 n=1 Tax=Microcebus murinus TaxID=30608 RepID=UPI000642BA99|nr:adenylate kinase isoenzyme 1-like isoform X5 [Microcebus murinus]XP_012617137.1 adenylate kinase isoenzyme 1-like isoform X5 [Microcebus murinus]